MNASPRTFAISNARAIGFEECSALTVKSSEGDMPQGREINFPWLAGTVLTGLTSFVLMAAALQVSFKGQDTFSTPYDALAIQSSISTQIPAHTAIVKTRRSKPVTQTLSDKVTIEASIREIIDGVTTIKNQPFTRIQASLATTATAVSDGIPEYDPVELLARNEPKRSASAAESINTDIYGADVEGEVTIRTAALPSDLMPNREISDDNAALFVRASVEDSYTIDEAAAFAYANSANLSLNTLSTSAPGTMSVSSLENVTAMPKTRVSKDMDATRTERVFTIREATPLRDALVRNGFTAQMADAVMSAMRNIYPNSELSPGSRIRILFASTRGTETLIPYRISIYAGNTHRVTVALTDRGQYVSALEPPKIEFTEEDTEEVNMANLPSIYRSLWETGRKHDLSDATIDRIAALFAYDLDLTKRINPGDSIEILMSGNDSDETSELLHVALNLSDTKKELYRYQSANGSVDYYGGDGDTGKQFLIRRPLEGGGTLRSRYGGRKHPVYGTYKVHSGVDLAAKTGTPIYAAGDGVVERAQWFSGYGRYVEIRHANGYATAYGHMSAIADGTTPGTRVAQGQIIGYVGSTGVSTGPHLHFEIKINGRTTDPLSVKLPRANSLPESEKRGFENTIAQLKLLMKQEPAATTTVAAH